MSFSASSLPSHVCDVSRLSVFSLCLNALHLALLLCAPPPKKQMEADDLEWYLASQGVVETDMEENPARAKGRGANSIKMRRGKAAGRGGRRADSDDDFDDDGEDDRAGDY